MRNVPVFLLLLLAGCDHGYGISRRARVLLLPAPALVESVIRDVPGIDNVQYDLSQGGRPLTLTGIKSPDQVHSFLYHGGSSVHGSVLFVVDYRGRVEYSQSLMALGRRPPQEFVDATRPVMLEIERRLERSCGLKNLAGAVKEYCYGVTCK